MRQAHLRQVERRTLFLVRHSGHTHTVRAVLGGLGAACGSLRLIGLPRYLLFEHAAQAVGGLDQGLNSIPQEPLAHQRMILFGRLLQVLPRIV